MNAQHKIEAPPPSPNETNEKYLMHHQYDGIQEYDNPLPGWWVAIFYGSIIFAAVYFIGFHVAHWGKTLDETYTGALTKYSEARAEREAAELANMSEELLAKGAGDPAVVDHGHSIFDVRCATCHGPDGRGLIGPNLTDEYQLHGSHRMDIYKTVRGGVTGTAMPAWGEQLSSEDINDVVEYAITLRGTNVPGGKAPQGQKVGRF